MHGTWHPPFSIVLLVGSGWSLAQKVALGRGVVVIVANVVLWLEYLPTFSQIKGLVSTDCMVVER